MNVGPKLFQGKYVLPLIHLCVCLIALLGSVVPRWESLARAWGLLFIVDVPISFVPLILVWKHEVAAGLWLLVAGTFWWYLLGRLVDAVCGKIFGSRHGTST